MISFKFGLKRVLWALVDCYLLSLWFVITSFRRFCYSLYSLFRPTFQLRRLSQLSLLVILFACSLTYSMHLLNAEYYYSVGMKAHTTVSRIENLRLSTEWYPFSYQFRSASAIQL